MTKRIMVVIIVLCLMVSVANADQVVVSWCKFNFVGLKSYNLYVKNNMSGEQKVYVITPDMVTNDPDRQEQDCMGLIYGIDILPDMLKNFTYQFFITIVDNYGTETDPSDVVVKIIKGQMVPTLETDRFGR